MGIAQFVKKIHGRDEESGGGMVLFRVDPKAKYTHWSEETGERLELESNYVVVSAVIYGGLNGRGSPETYIFPANHQGKVLDWMQLEGSFQGDLDIPQALANAGYTIQ